MKIQCNFLPKSLVSLTRVTRITNKNADLVLTRDNARKKKKMMKLKYLPVASNVTKDCFS